MVEITNTTLEKAFSIHTQISEFYEADSLKYFTERLKNTTPIILQATYNNILAGYAIAYDKYNDGSLYCWMAGVIPKYRKLGVLSQMMNHLEKYALEKEYTSITITTRNTRREMLSFLVKNNFLFTEVEHRDNIEENRILLTKNI